MAQPSSWFHPHHRLDEQWPLKGARCPDDLQAAQAAEDVEPLSVALKAVAIAQEKEQEVRMRMVTLGGTPSGSAHSKRYMEPDGKELDDDSDDDHGIEDDYHDDDDDDEVLSKLKSTNQELEESLRSLERSHYELRDSLNEDSLAPAVELTQQMNADLSETNAALVRRLEVAEEVMQQLRAEKVPPAVNLPVLSVTRRLSPLFPPSP